MFFSHPKQFESVPVHYVWEHFIKQPEEKAKCVYCYSVLGCPKNVVGNLIRHLKSRHPSLVLEQERGQEALFEVVSRTQYHAESIEDSLGTSTSLQELELELDADLFSAEVHQIDGTNLPSSVKIEVKLDGIESRFGRKRLCIYFGYPSSSCIQIPNPVPMTQIRK